VCLPSQALARATYRAGEAGAQGDRAERADQAVVGGEPVPGHLARIHDVRQARKHRIGEPMAAQIVPNPLDRVDSLAGAARRTPSLGSAARSPNKAPIVQPYHVEKTLWLYK